MRNTRVWQRLLGLPRTVVERAVFDDETGAVIVEVRPRRAGKGRCGRCGKRAGWYDRGDGRRRWRALDVGEVPCWLEADAARVNCRVHGPTVMAVPWARHGAGHTLAFDAQVAWLATHTSKSAVCALMRIAWRTVGAIITRVVADGRAAADPFAGLRRIGIDEISYKRGHRYVMVVVDHDTGRLVWAAPGHDKATLAGFFDQLGAQRCTEIALVSADAMAWIGDMVHERCVNATLCLDAYHMGAAPVEARQAAIGIVSLA